MATRAKALRQFAKKYFNLDLVGMSETAVLKDLLKKEYNIDAVGNSVVSVLMNAAGDDDGGNTGTIVLTPRAEADFGASVYYVNSGDDCSLIFPGIGNIIDTVSYNGEEIPYGSPAWDEFDIKINGLTPENYWEDVQIPHECGDTSIVAGEKYPVTYAISYNGATGSATIDVPIVVGA